MLNYIVEGGKKINGEVTISGSKNASLPILATAILNKEKVTFYNVPEIEDIKITLEILKLLGCKVSKKYDKITISSYDMNKTEIPEDLMKKSRSTVILAGAILGRFKKAKFTYPGGCNIGARPIDLHLDSFKKLGIDIKENNEEIECSTKNIIGNRINLEFPSVGATENIILASIYATGTTHIINAAKEPEIVDLARCLNCMGAKIYGAGTKRITIIGVKKLHKLNYRIMPDRIEAGTFLCAAAITNGKIKIDEVNPNDMMSTLYVLKNIGCKITIKNESIQLVAYKKNKNTNIETNPYPNFPTDMQPIMSAVLTKSYGKSIVTENIFENRFKYIEGLKKMGADIKEINNKVIEINGVNELKGTEVESNDLRGGAALVIAGLAGNGVTKINNADYILRGYENFEKKLNKLGANVKIEKVV